MWPYASTSLHSSRHPPMRGRGQEAGAAPRVPGERRRGRGGKPCAGDDRVRGVSPAQPLGAHHFLRLPLAHLPPQWRSAPALSNLPRNAAGFRRLSAKHTWGSMATLGSPNNPRRYACGPSLFECHVTLCGFWLELSIFIACSVPRFLSLPNTSSSMTLFKGDATPQLPARTLAPFTLAYRF